VPFNENAAAEVDESNDHARDLTPGFNNARDPYYSPNGKKIVFASDDAAAGAWDLYILDLDPATDYGSVLPGATPVKLNLTSYNIFSNMFDDINRPVWTL
jgi:Tol biopolymer transport system component